MKKLYHFLGGLTFALILIAVTACFVIAGTFIESTTGSHRHAAYLTYNNPLFLLLLGLFFVNILLSALRRWPFKLKHVPFLLTHLGLLMILAGTMIKSVSGIQGSIRVMEGGVSQQLIIPDSHALLVESRDGMLKQAVELTNLKALATPSLTLTEYSPHSTMRHVTWIKGDSLSVSGLRSVPLSNAAPYERGALAKVFPNESQPWEIYAVRADNVAGAAYQIYLHNLDVVIGERNSGKVLHAGPLKELLASATPASAAIHFGYTCEDGFCDPAMLINYQGQRVGVPLDGASALLNRPMQSELTLSVDLVRNPALAFIVGPDGQTHLFAFDAHGHVHAQTFNEESLSSLVVYDRGFGGYAIQAIVPFSSFVNGRKEREEAIQSGDLASIAAEEFCIETPLCPIWESATPQAKWENNIPRVLVKVKEDNKTQYVALGYDPTAAGIKWPILGGDYVMRYQPLVIEIPYQVRLRQARQITYSNTAQPYSYESDIALTDSRTGDSVRTTLSMNEVHETADGYRFYMANVNPSDPGKVKEVQIIVNYDPARYRLTYPGGIVLAIGIISLFWFKPYRKKTI